MMETAPPDGPGGRELVAVAIGLAALLLLFFAAPIMPGRILSSADSLFLLPPWRYAAPPGFEPANRLLGDHVLQFRPWRDLALDALRAGRLPLWNPYSYAGAPLLGNVQAAVLYPLNFPFLLLPEATAIALWAALRLWVAGFFTYACARVLGLSPAGAMVSSLAFGYCGYLVVWLLWPQVNVGVWLPALVLATEAVVRRPSAPRVAGLAAVACVQFLGGYPPNSLHLLFAVTLFALWRAGSALRSDGNRRAFASRLGAFAGGVSLGAGAAALQLVPFAEYLWHSVAWHDRGAIAPAVWAIPQYPKLLSLLALACPYCFGSPLRGDAWLGDPFEIANFNELNGAYVGVVTWVLAGVAVAFGAGRSLDRFLLVLAALVFCVVYGIPPVYNAFQALPPFRLTVNGRMMVVLAFALALLAGRGLDRLAELPPARRRRVLWAGWAGLALAALAIGSWCLFAAVRARAGPWLAFGLPVPPERVLSLLARVATERVVVLTLSGVALAVAVSQARRRVLGAGVVAAVLVLDLFAFGRNYTPAIPRPLAHPTHAAIEFVRRQPGLFRVLGIEATLWPNTSMLYGLYEVRGYDPLGPALLHRLLDATGPFPQPVWMIHLRTLLFANVGSRLVDLLNVRYVMADRELSDPKLELVLADGVRVYENRAALPRAFLVYESRVLPDAASVEAALRAPAFDPGRTVLLEQGPSLSGPADPTARAAITRYRPEEVDVEVTTSREGVLVLSDSWFPGWRASVDGVETPLLRADLALRAVTVPAGVHRVSFRYAPLSVRIGALLSGLSLAAGLGLAATAVPGLAGRARRSPGDTRPGTSR